MANTLNGVNLAAISNMTLDALLDEMPRLDAFSTDFSPEVASVGASITTRVASAYTAQDFAATTADADSTSTAVTITLSNWKGVRIAFSDKEWTESAVNLNSIFVRPLVHAVVNDFYDTLLALVTNANYGAAGFVGAAGTFSADSVNALGKALTNKKVPKQQRTLMLSPDYFEALLNDANIQSADAYGGSEATRQGVIPGLGGFRVEEYTDIPANAENLVGFATGPQALVLAGRAPATPENFKGVIANATEPGSGFTLQTRAWYSEDDRKFRFEGGVLYGVAKGTDSLSRMTSI